jgi:hypothetical protein
VTGAADSLSDRTRFLLARFFDKNLSYFLRPGEQAGASQDVAQALAARFATFDRSQIDAIRAAIAIVDGSVENGE